jgi:hypothetical protein
MKKFNLSQAQSSVGFQREAIYNALDTITTLEIDNVLEKQMHPDDVRTMNFYLASQGTALDMTVRGIAVDPIEREQLVSDLNKELRRTVAGLAAHPQIKPVWDKLEKNTGACAAPSRKDGKHKWAKGVPDGPERKCDDCGASRMKVRPFKPSSDDDLIHLFYDVWKLKGQYNKDHKLTGDKEARGKLKDKYPKYADAIDMINQFADTKKQLEFLAFRSDDGRFHAGFNVGVTSTGRWSSNKDAFGQGGNAQNITEKHRHIFVADPGMELCYADLKQAESNVIAHVAGDENYIEAHRVGDTHTFVTRLVWPEGINGQQWTGDIFADKKIATSAAPPWDNRPGHDYRFQAKAVQHGSNLGLTAFGLAIQKHIPQEAAREGQRRYFKAFPGIREYQTFTRNAVQNQDHIVTPLGVRFKLFGRPWDDSTFKEGLAKVPQSMVGSIVAIGLWRIFKYEPDIQLLAQVHDAILFQFPKGQYEYVYRALEHMTVPVPIKGVDGKTRTISIATEAAVGNNWGHRSEKNPDGVSEIIFTSPTSWSIK